MPEPSSSSAFVEDAEPVLEPPRRASSWWLAVVLLALGALTAFILVAAGENQIPFMYTTPGS